jgi:predicted Fe-Mo cluster-binding NifX family protein
LRFALIREFIPPIYQFVTQYLKVTYVESGLCPVWWHASCNGCSFVRIAIPTWEHRISPVFDVAKRLLLVETEGAAEVARDEVAVAGSDVAVRARRVTELGVDVLICGAISQPLEALLASAGVRVISQTCGGVEEVLRAFVAGELANNNLYLMPGCCGRRRRFRGEGGQVPGCRSQGHAERRANRKGET